MTTRRLLSVLIGLVAAAGPAGAQRRTVLDQIRVPHNYYFREMYLPQVTSGPGWVAWLPDGRGLVYSMAGTLWRQALGSTRADQLSDGPGYDLQPDVSPDGRQVVYASYQHDAVQLRLLDLATGQTAPLVDNGAVNVEPRWSPDGSRIAFVSTADQGRWHVFLLEVRGGKAVGAPARVSLDLDSKLPRYYYGAYDHYISPTWSPDGKELIVVSNAGRIWGTGGFWRIKAEAGLAPRQIHYEETAWKARPDWSPDGKRVVYSSFLGRSWNQLFLMTADGENPFQLTYGDYDNTNPRWSPDATKIAFITNQGGNTSLRVLTIPGGEPAAVTPAERRFLTPHVGVTVTVTDAGRPTPARVSITGPDGRGYFPPDAWAHADDGFDRSERPFEFTYFHTGGSSVVELAAGRYVIETTRGYEYARQVDTITVGARPVTHRVALRRLANLPLAGWWSGDLHIHMNYGGHYRNTPAHLRLQSEAEDLHVAENLVVNKETRIPDITYFAGGGLDPVSTRTTLIKHDEEYHTSFWGHSGLLGLSRFFVMPNYAGYVATAAASLFPHNTVIYDLAHGQGGVTGYVHPFESVPDFSKGETISNAIPIDAALGKVDYIEVVGFSDHLSTAEIWYRILNTGVRLPTGAGTDAMADYASLRGPVGLGRVYVKSGRRLDYRGWLAALKAGRTFATNGPLLGFTLGGREIGASLDLPSPGSLSATIRLRSFVAVDSLQVISNGRVVHSVPLTGDHTRADATVTLPVERSAWFTLRAFARHSRHPVLDVYPFATTSPIYVTVGAAPIRSPGDARYFIQWLDQLETKARDHEGWNSAAEKATVLGDIRKARAFFDERSR